MMKRLLSAGLLLATSLARADMVEMDDDRMSSVTGTGNGISFEISMLFNTDSSGAPLSIFGTGCATNAAPCSAKVAVQFENNKGTWLVLKDFYGMLSIPDLQLDVYVNPVANTAYWNKSRFITAPFQGTQTCISDIASCNPAGMDSFAFSFPGASTNYSDIGLYLNIGRMAVEYDSGGSVCSTVNSSSCGYNQDTRGSFAGLVISDATQKMAQMSVMGQVRVYGF